MEKTHDKKLVRAAKSIVVNPEQSNYIDQKVIQKQFYNSFNYSMLPEDHDPLNLTIGVTSPNKGSGKR